MAFENLIVDRDGAVSTITINRPKVLNALNGATLDELGAAIDDAHRDADARASFFADARYVAVRAELFEPAVARSVELGKLA